MASITPFLWFEDHLEEAVEFYTGIFPDARVTEKAVYPPGSMNDMAGKLMTATLELAGQRLILLNGGPAFKFNEAISLFIACQDQAEVDYYWERLLDGGKAQQCGWLSDRYGLVWQVVPMPMFALIQGPETAKAERAMQAMLQMVKLDLGELQHAYDGG